MQSNILSFKTAFHNNAPTEMIGSTEPVGNTSATSIPHACMGQM